jgi:hypothetical protein
MSSPPSHNALQNHAVSTYYIHKYQKQTLSRGSMMFRNLGDLKKNIYEIFFLNSGYSQAQKISTICRFKFHFFKISKQGVCVTLWPCHLH